MPQITIGKGLAFYEETQALPGVKRVAGMVKQDIELVTGVSPAGITSGQGLCRAVRYHRAQPHAGFAGSRGQT